MTEAALPMVEDTSPVDPLGPPAADAHKPKRAFHPPKAKAQPPASKEPVVPRREAGLRRFEVVRDFETRLQGRELRLAKGKVVTDQGYHIEALRAAGVPLREL